MTEEYIIDDNYFDILIKTLILLYRAPKMEISLSRAAALVKYRDGNGD
jgi:hypothetical protein